MSLLLAQMRSTDRVRKCLLFGVDRTYRGHHETDALDPIADISNAWNGADNAYGLSGMKARPNTANNRALSFSDWDWDDDPQKDLSPRRHSSGIVRRCGRCARHHSEGGQRPDRQHSRL